MSYQRRAVKFFVLLSSLFQSSNVRKYGRVCQQNGNQSGKNQHNRVNLHLNDSPV
jgi:hypothetical protein